ncbi:retinoic acid receptor RXR-alpha-like isoform X2 [Polyodon spathula]|uniref:retinoic acid receptor RXR-alpha-like isoform X2 n=1 Tax=Polyodon spathula TaxID=7913 RepID=UPI001B7EE9F8|nr:retinoic acid receptor RXR-alpha-like isoform X2 [Polyodon spathula]
METKPFSSLDSSHMNSISLSSPNSHRGMNMSSLHPSLIGTGISPSSLGSSGQLHSPISTLSSPMNGMGSPFSVISSPMGPHSMTGPSTPGMGFGPSLSPQPI